MWGQGVMTESVAAISKTIQGIDENILLQANCRIDNFASKRVLIKNQFKLIGSEFIDELEYYRYELSNKTSTSPTY